MPHFDFSSYSENNYIIFVWKVGNYFYTGVISAFNQRWGIELIIELIHYDIQWV